MKKHSIREFASYQIFRYFRSNKGALLYQLCLFIALCVIVFYQSGLFMTALSLSVIIGFVSHYVLIADLELVIRDGKRISGPVLSNILIVTINNFFIIYNQMWAFMLGVWLVPIIIIIINFFRYFRK